MISYLRQGFAHWRRLGPRNGTAAAVRLAVRGPRTAIRRGWLRRRPLRASPAEVRAALCGDAVEIFGTTVAAAMPTVAAFQRKLAEMPEDERAELLAVAEGVAAHRFDLLGSGPTDLGPEIDWALDFKSGRRWPLDHISRVPIVFPDDSDIKVPWELSRFQHLPVLAAAYRLTGERRWLNELGLQLEDWIVKNPVEFGPNWACTMDVAIRGANWVAALALVADAAADEHWFEPTLASLLLHGRFIRTHPEWAPVRGNHYLSDVVGLLCVAAPFCRSTEGREWARWAAVELATELRHQVRADGCDHEASIPYHRLVTELVVCGIHAAEALLPEAAVAENGRRPLDAMLAFVQDYTRPDGYAPQVGDADDGRFLPLGDYGRADPRSHLHLFAQAGKEYEAATDHAAYPDGGFWIMRSGELYVLIRCGDVGVGGVGSHAHNDALSFELALGRQSLIIDPGSYLYTADPLERNRFRSTAFHSTLQLDGAEQNALSSEFLFAMEDRRRAECLGWETDGRSAGFTGRHHGYEVLDEPATHTRRIDLAIEEAIVTVTDVVESAGVHNAVWTLPLAPCGIEIESGRAVALFPSGVRLEVVAEGVELRVDDGWFAPSYGRRIRTPFLRASKRTLAGEDTTVMTLRAWRDTTAEPDH